MQNCSWPLTLSLRATHETGPLCGRLAVASMVTKIAGQDVRFDLCMNHARELTAKGVVVTPYAPEFATAITEGAKLGPEVWTFSRETGWRRSDSSEGEKR